MSVTTGSSVTVSKVLLPGGVNHFYTGNRPPLLAEPLIKLPLGSIEPEGWVRHQLQAEAEGMVGHLEELSPWCRRSVSAWVHPEGQGEYGWEEMPYWLRGFVDLGFLLHDQRITESARHWIDDILGSQRPNGYFGPTSNLTPVPDLWPNMIVLFALRSYYEATRDERVLPFMERYFRWQMSLPLEQFLPNSWQKVRGGDNLDSIYWLYNQTGHSWLLDLARVTHERTADWAGDIPSWHGVNICQGFREPAQYYQQTLDVRYREATERNYATVMKTYGQVPGGMFGADENARPGFTGPRQAAETCSIVEIMFSHEILARITGDGIWADRCEEVAFNSLPAALTPDLKALHYLTAPNMVQLDRRSKAPLLQNGGDMLSYSPFEQYRCCQHNVSFGWPYYAEHLWLATRGDGLAATLYAPCTVRARAGAQGAQVEIREETEYPFGERIRFHLENVVGMGSGLATARFPLVLRVPGWCPEPRLAVNGEELPVAPPEGGWGGWIVVEREWQLGDQVELQLPQRIRVQRWPANRNSVSVYRGPLAFSLRIGERWQPYASDSPYARAPGYAGEKQFPSYEVFSTTPWNYGLVLNETQPERSFEIVLPTSSERSASSEPDQPFTPDHAPVRLRAKARRLPSWQLEGNGLIQEVPPSPVATDEPVETVTLIPMGCARLRLSAFPVVTPDEK